MLVTGVVKQLENSKDAVGKFFASISCPTGLWFRMEKAETKVPTPISQIFPFANKNSGGAASAGLQAHFAYPGR